MLDRFGRLDIPVSNASVFIAKPLTDYTNVWVNLAGFFWLTERAIAEMVSGYGGHVVNVSATIAEVANSGTPLVLVALTKGGLAAATRSLAVGYASRGILVNAAHPALSRPRCTREQLPKAQRPGSLARPGRPGDRRRGRRLAAGVVTVITRRDAAYCRAPKAA